jgi:two-component system cell cycle sensor histidine kinase/response regulator CckA
MTPSTPKSPAQTNPIAPAAPAKSTYWILLVDDEAPVLQLIETVLSSRGFDVRTARGAPAALNLAKRASTPPALLICDVIMPQTDGLALTRQLRARLPGLKVIFISGKIADSAWWPADLSNIRLLAKPLVNADLILAVEEILADAEAQS